jgi:protein tyrosine phosphatase (PTP) superfamily phosphohydrolase (DUF442 family)
MAQFDLLRTLLVLMATLLLAGCRPQTTAPAPTTEQAATSEPARPSAESATPAQQPVGGGDDSAVPRSATRVTPEPAGLHNVFQVMPQLFSGSEPHGTEGFDSLAKLGVKTIVSVDGARPDVAAARDLGIRYVHIPIGYDGVPEQARLALARVMRESTGPVYVHCHHGKHRGPAAAAIACLAAGKLDAAGAEALLRQAGTSPDYTGLYRDVREFVPPRADQPLPDLNEVATVDSLVSGMADLGRHFDDLRLCRDAGWETPTGDPDPAAGGVALLVQEAFHEMARNADLSAHPPEFRELLQASESTAGELLAALTALNWPLSFQKMGVLERSCKQCHQRWRDR